LRTPRRIMATPRANWRESRAISSVRPLLGQVPSHRRRFWRG
jgi:hypothetical protein